MDDFKTKARLELKNVYLPLIFHDSSKMTCFISRCSTSINHTTSRQWTEDKSRETASLLKFLVLTTSMNYQQQMHEIDCAKEILYHVNVTGLCNLLD